MHDKGKPNQRTPYLHLNHVDRHHNQSMDQYQSKHKGQAYVSKTTNVSTIQSCDNNSHKVSNNSTKD